MVTAAYSCDRTAAALGLRRGGANGGGGGVARSSTEIDLNYFVHVSIFGLFRTLFGLSALLFGTFNS
jgi:hypothetical protein